MKLLKPQGCLSPGGRGNVKGRTKLVEGQGISFRTRVRLSSSPLEAAETNCRPTAQIAVFRNVFSIIVPTKSKDVPELKTEKERLVFEAFKYFGLV